MVSLINFKLVDDDLRLAATAAAAADQGGRLGEQRAETCEMSASASCQRPDALRCQSDAPKAEAAKMPPNQKQQRQPGDVRANKYKRASAGAPKQQLQQQQQQQQQQQHPSYTAASAQYTLECSTRDCFCARSMAPAEVTTTTSMSQAVETNTPIARAKMNDTDHNNQQLRLPAPGDRPGYEADDDRESSFTVTWRKLKFCIEPKWHEKLARTSSSSLQALTGRRAGATSNASASAGDQQTGTNQQAGVPRVVLDQLDGSFKSGELTAILGPSGAGKTTLLDCLTGHRKTGLSGSIRISSSSCSSSLSHDPYGLETNLPGSGGGKQQKNLILAQQHNTNYASKLTVPGGRKSPTSSSTSGRLMNGENLKVSIIPQNDHLIGHLTVYETLNYASKMKNCFEGRNFDHKLNVRRVAQQLGLMSCLETRINKLSGGQYKRVSIAQELLSSPDILILDEPTSGLDAMTCFQTVQVLKELTESQQQQQQQQQPGAKSIAVILTIHQPNSDVFQQFNHVYVVAQGGKCIFEGPPAHIESVIQRVGLCLPNSYYNPATMIVEVAAGKFGQEAICQLNDIQRSQYSAAAKICEAPAAADEQNSTGDSAVDCPSSSPSSSSSSSSTSSNFDDEERERGDENNNNNNNHGKRARWTESAKSGGVINEGFFMEAGEAAPFDANNNRPPPPQEAESNKLAISKEAPIFVDDNKQSQHADRRERRCRPRRRADALTPTEGHARTPTIGIMITSAGGDGGGRGGDDDEPNDDQNAAAGARREEKRLKLNSLKADQKFPFWRHTYLHFHRSWLSIVRDPMLCGMQLALHIIVPVMVSLVYGTYVGKPNACPRAGPIDIMAYALEPTDKALQLQEDLRTTLENIGYIFFKLYGIIFAAMTVTVLTFPLDMHVLVKEFRNGWYGLSSYFLGRTLADIPFQLTLPLLAMSLSYYATGQPYSYFQWRFFSITAILILSSLIAQSQGLLFGAILMDRMKAAVFVAPAATTPIILFAGFLVRTQSIPRYLRPLSNLSYLRYAIEACLISRYGFNQCECDPAIFNQTVPELPPIARSMLDYWLSSFPQQQQAAADDLALRTGLSTTSTSTTLAPEPEADKPDLFNKLIDSLARANSFGRNITSCDQVVPYPMIDYDLKDSQLFSCFAILLTMLILTRLLTFFIVCFKVKRKV